MRPVAPDRTKSSTTADNEAAVRPALAPPPIVPWVLPDDLDRAGSFKNVLDTLDLSPSSPRILPAHAGAPFRVTVDCHHENPARAPRPSVGLPAGHPAGHRLRPE